MPRTKLGEKYSPKPPEIDILRAYILERKAVLKVSTKELAAVCHVSYGVMRRYMTQSPGDWPASVRNSACKRLGLKVTSTVEIA